MCQAWSWGHSTTRCHVIFNKYSQKPRQRSFPTTKLRPVPVRLLVGAGIAQRVTFHTNSDPLDCGAKKGLRLPLLQGKQGPTGLAHLSSGSQGPLPNLRILSSWLLSLSLLDCCYAQSHARILWHLVNLVRVGEGEGRSRAQFCFNDMQPS